MEDFASRLRFILGDRKKHPWGKRLGIAQAVVTTMFEGTVPSADSLNAIARAENLNLSWLLAGKGPPFVTHACRGDSDALQLIDQLLPRGRWSAYLLTESRDVVLVLTREESMRVREREIAYTRVEVLTGRPGMRTFEAVRRSSKAIHLARIDGETMADLYGGRVGTHRLTQPGGLLEICRSSVEPASILAGFDGRGESDGEEPLEQSIRLVEALLERGAATADERARLISVAYGLLPMYGWEATRRKLAELLPRHNRA